MMWIMFFLVLAFVGLIFYEIEKRFIELYVEINLLKTRLSVLEDVFCDFRDLLTDKGILLVSEDNANTHNKQP